MKSLLWLVAALLAVVLSFGAGREHERDRQCFLEFGVKEDGVCMVGVLKK